jgi:hypothetical protein
VFHARRVAALAAVNPIRDYERVLAGQRRQGETGELFIALFELSAGELEMQHVFQFPAGIAEDVAFGCENSRSRLLTRLPPNFAPENQLPERDYNFLSSS